MKPKHQTKLAPRELVNLSKTALADLVWALADELAHTRDVFPYPGQKGLGANRGIEHDDIAWTIARVFDACELASTAVHGNAQGTDAVPADVQVIRRFMRGVVPGDWPVRPLLTEATRKQAKDPVTCGTCWRSWDDAIPTSYTPGPSGRCPFEAFHAEVKS